MKHPMQNIENGRFVENKIVSYLLDNGGIDMNDLASLNFSNEDREHFAQLIGYSVSGYSSLSYVSDESVDQASLMTTSQDWRDARISALELKLEAIREALRAVAVQAFAIHPDDLNSRPIV